MTDNYISKVSDKGTINISEDVLSNIVRNSIIDIEGVSGLSNTAGAEIAEFIGLKSVPKGVKIQSVDETVIVDTIITVSYGFNIVDVAKKVQNEIISAVTSCTGIEDVEVNVHVAGISF